MRKKFISVLSLLASDFLCIFLCFFVAFLIRKEILPSIIPELKTRPVYIEGYFRQFYMYLVWVIVFYYEKLYTMRYTFWDEAQKLFKATTISFALVMLTVYMTAQWLKFSRLVILEAWIFSILLLPVFRYGIKSILLKYGFWRKKVIIIGSIDSSTSLIKAIRENKILGFEIVGCLCDDPLDKEKTINGVQILGRIDEIEKWKKTTGFEDIIVTLPDMPREKLIPLMKIWDQISDTIRYIPRTGDLISTGVNIENIGSVLSLAVRKNLFKPWNILVKSVFDFILAFIIFVLLLPFFLIAAAAIKIDSRGPVFFVQERFGKREKRFQCFKFRSMYQDADERLETHLWKNPEAGEEWKKYKKLKANDPRVTRVGRFLRKYSLDELPQLINILKGEMSLVGPRPYILTELKDYSYYKTILSQVKPGITGLWQISGRSLLTFQERLNLDEHYIRNWSLWLDVVILIKTIQAASSGKGAF
ncbi:MAG: sugar transferase [Candidatus Aminicenantes bacterium]